MPPPCVPRPLPLELNCELFKCLKLPIQRKFIWALGRGIYGMFGQELLIKSTRLRNPRGNHWNYTYNTKVTIHPDGLCISKGTREGQKAVAEQGFPISEGHTRPDHFPGTILFYFEVNHAASPKYSHFCIGLSSSNESIPAVRSFNVRSDACGTICCYISGKRHPFEWPNGIRPIWDEGNAKVSGCGLLLSPKDQLSIFFTVNGVLRGKSIPICPPAAADFLYPTIFMRGWAYTILEANFGDDSTKPFKYDIGNCPGMNIIPIQQD